MRIEQVDPVTATDADLAAWQRCLAASLLSQWPDEPTPPVHALADLIRNPGTTRPYLVYLAWDDPRQRVLGGLTTTWLDAENAHMVFGNIDVDPRERRRGVGRALAGHGRQQVKEQGRALLLGAGPYDTGAVDFARAVGAKLGLDEYRSRLLLQRADLPTIAPIDGYSLASWVAHCPPEHVDSYARLKPVMNSAPTGDLSFKPETWDVTRLRNKERMLADRGRREHIMAARDDATGELVAFTQVIVADSWPEAAEQGDTGVLAEHRGRGLARWVKSAMAHQLRAERPELQILTTYNATVNEAMLAVNKAIGYSDFELWSNVELPA